MWAVAKLACSWVNFWIILDFPKSVTCSGKVYLPLKLVFYILRIKKRPLVCISYQVGSASQVGQKQKCCILLVDLAHCINSMMLPAFLVLFLSGAVVSVYDKDTNSSALLLRGGRVRHLLQATDGRPNEVSKDKTHPVCFWTLRSWSLKLEAWSLKLEAANLLYKSTLMKNSTYSTGRGGEEQSECHSE